MKHLVGGKESYKLSTILPHPLTYPQLFGTMLDARAVYEKSFKFTAL
jgi:hypothetical protein